VWDFNERLALGFSARHQTGAGFIPAVARIHGISTGDLSLY